MKRLAALDVSLNKFQETSCVFRTIACSLFHLFISPSILITAFPCHLYCSPQDYTSREPSWDTKEVAATLITTPPCSSLTESTIWTPVNTTSERRSLTYTRPLPLRLAPSLESCGARLPGVTAPTVSSARSSPETSPQIPSVTP